MPSNNPSYIHLENNLDSNKVNNSRFNYRPGFNFHPKSGMSIKESTDVDSMSRQDFDASTALNTTGGFNRGIKSQQS